MNKHRIICGINAVAGGLASGVHLHKIVLASGRPNARIQELLETARARQIEVEYADRAGLDRMCATEKHQGIAAYTDPPPRVELEALLKREKTGARFFLLVDGVTDPHNFGALIRSAAAAGCDAVIYPKDRSCGITPVVEKASAGTLDRVPLCQVTNLVRAVKRLKEDGVWVYALAAERAEHLFCADLSGDVALVAGSEGKGVRPGVIGVCDGALSIPMPGQIESLNVSVATGIAMFEVVRQRLNAEKK